MGFMDKLFGGKKAEELLILAPVAGEVLPLSAVSDPTFGEEILGKGVAIMPQGSRVVSPVAGTVAMMFSTGHAVSIMADFGAEILIHVGLDTVKLKGEGYTVHVKDGDRVQPGDLLMEFDKELIQRAGYEIITPVVICNTADYASVEGSTGKTVQELDTLLRLQK